MTVLAGRTAVTPAAGGLAAALVPGPAIADTPATTVKVTAKWGYATSVPSTIKTATMMQAARWYKRFQSAMADVVADAALGTLLYRQELDPDVKMLLVAGRYVKMAIGRH